jgi:3-methyladenine DNA glycosylase AlkD
MPKSTLAPKKHSKPTRSNKAPAGKTEATVESAVAELKRLATKATLDGMARYAIPSDRAFGVAMRDVQALAKQLGRNHKLASELWETGWYEARLLATYVDEPDCITIKQMDQWCRDFDNWAICDTVCFALFDRTPHAWSRVEPWSQQKEEFRKRAAFALLWGLCAHDDDATDDQFAKGLNLIEHAAEDERNFVKKSVNMALRSIGRRSRKLHTAAVKLARRLSDSSNPAARWIGKDAFRELTSEAVVKRVAEKA